MDNSMSNPTRTLSYYRGQQFSRQWRLFMGVLLKGLTATAGREDTEAFFDHMGKKMAQELRIGEQDTVEGLEAAINAHWQELDWGWCQFYAEPNMITIVHDAWPRLEGSAQGPWCAALASLLRGIYNEWLHGQGGAGEVSVRVVRADPNEPLEFCYGC